MDGRIANENNTEDEVFLNNNVVGENLTFCGHQRWRATMKTSCNERVQYITKRYGISDQEARISIMKNKDCICNSRDFGGDIGSEVVTASEDKKSGYIGSNTTSLLLPGFIIASLMMLMVWIFSSSGRHHSPRRISHRTVRLFMYFILAFLTPVYIISMFELANKHSIYSTTSSFQNTGINRLGVSSKFNVDILSVASIKQLNLRRGLNNDLKLLQELTAGKTKKRGDGSTIASCPSPLQLFEHKIVDPSSSSNSNTTVIHHIPRILHLSERSRCLNRDMYDALEKWKENFPSYSIFFHDDEAVDRLLLSEEGVYSDWRKDFPDLVEILPCVSQGAMKIDIWRVLVLYKFGGLYFDADIVPDKLTEDTINPGSSWFSLTDAWERPSQWLFAISAGHVSCKNTLQIIAKRVLDQRNIQDINLVHVTGPQALYWGWKDAIVNASLPESEEIEGKTHRFTDGSWGQIIERGSSWTSSYWDEMVPFEKNLCVSRKTRTQKHFGRVHWTTAKGTGRIGLPRLSCRKHLESLHLDQEKKGHPDENISAKEDILATKGNEALLTTNIDDLILKNSNNVTMCAQLAKEDEEKKEHLRSNSTYCGSCSWGPHVTCDARMEYMISRYQMSVEDAFQQVIGRRGDKCKHSN